MASYRYGMLLVLLAGGFWSTMGLGIRLIETANVWQILFYRSLALAPFLFFVITLNSVGKPISVIRKSGLAGIVGGLGLLFAFSAGIFAIQNTSVANAMLLFAAAPFITALLGLLLLREPIRKATWIAMAFALAGIAVMVWNRILAGHIVGNISALISALGFSVFTIALRWQKSEDMMPAVFLAGIFSIITSGVICYAVDYTFQIPLSDIFIALSLGIFQVGAGLTIYTIGSKSVPAAELALLSMTEVVLGPIWVWIFLGETASFFTLLGGAILLAAISGNAVTGIRRKSVPPL